MRYTLLVTLALALQTDGLASVAPPLRRPALGLPRARCALCDAGDAVEPAAPAPEPPADVAPVSAEGGIRAWFSKWMKFDRDSLSKLGIDAFFCYGLVSNLNAGLTISVAWLTFCQSTGLSPLAPGQWPKFLAIYATIYATFGTVTRPFRMAGSVAVTPLFSRGIKRLQARLPFGETRPKLNRTLAIVIVSIIGNIVCTFLLIGAGIWLAGLVSGVPAFPPGARLPFSRVAV